MDDPQLRIEIVQGIHDGERNLPQDVFRNPASITVNLRVELVQTGVHDFHANPYVALSEKGAVELYRVRTRAAAHRYVQVHEQAFLFLKCSAYVKAGEDEGTQCGDDYLGVDGGGDPLHCHYGATGDVPHLFYYAVRASSQVRDSLEVVGFNVECLIAYRYRRSCV